MKKKDLNELTKRLRAELQDAAVGPLRIAQQVVQIAEDWESHRAAAGGVDLTEWLKELHPEHKLSWYRERARAVEVLGPVAMRCHHSGAVTIVRQVPGEYIEALKLGLHRLYRTNGSMYVTTSQVQKAIRVVMARVEVEKKARVCARCDELEARIERLELQVRSLGALPVA